MEGAANGASDKKEKRQKITANRFIRLSLEVCDEPIFLRRQWRGQPAGVLWKFAEDQYQAHFLERRAARNELPFPLGRLLLLMFDVPSGQLGGIGFYNHKVAICSRIARQVNCIRVAADG